ncbi:unnamed protein product [Allacma fusca]|nr:unnamed protein product [Allacma fusca]
MNNLDEIGENEIKARKEFVRSKFDRWEKIVHKVLNVLQKIFGFYFVFIIYKAIKYRKKYLNRISYDNQYISVYFRKIDDRRIHQGRSHLLPLKNFEKMDYIIVTMFKLTSEERIIIIPRIFALGVISSILGTIFILDGIITKLLLIFRRDEDFLIRVQGSYVVDVRIEGKGTLAQILRSIVHEINVKYNVDLVHQTKPCLPTVHKLRFLYTATAAGLLILILILCFCEVLSRRLRHNVMDYFYKMRAKRRTLWLYNECLRRRATRIEIIKRKLIQNASSFRNRDDYKILKTIKTKFPWLWTFLEKFNLDFRQCLLCKSKEEFYRCPICSFYFCSPCFEDMDGNCLYCEARMEMLELMNEKFDDEETVALVKI